MSQHLCRCCGHPLSRVFCDLGSSPPSNAYLRPEQLDAGEMFFPLRALVCDDCLLVQLPQYQRPDEIFSDYAYFSSYAQSWLEHARRYVEEMTRRFDISPRDLVVEVASNDGYLLRNFHAHGVPVLGIEPAANVAAVAEAQGIRSLVRFFGTELARELVTAGSRADLLIGNNVLAHVPDLNDFVEGLSIVLAPTGVLTMEFPHLMQLMQGNQYDTIYHEHFSYFSLTTARRLFARHGLSIFDVDTLSTHGGSLRIYVQHDSGAQPLSARVEQVIEQERQAGLLRPESYDAFHAGVERSKRELLSFLIRAREDGRTVVGYGAPAKGNTLLNFCGVRSDLLAFTVDQSPHKQGTYLPGSRIPVLAPEALRAARPDYVLVLPWNLRDEVTAEHAYIREWGGRFVVPIPRVEVLP